MLWQGVENIWIFARFWSCWENPSKSLRAVEKKKEKVEANCTGFSAEFFGSQSVEMFCQQENENSNIDNFFPERELDSLFLNPYDFKWNYRLQLCGA